MPHLMSWMSPCIWEEGGCDMSAKRSKATICKGSKHKRQLVVQHCLAVGHIDQRCLIPEQRQLRKEATLWRAVQELQIRLRPTRECRALMTDADRAYTKVLYIFPEYGMACLQISTGGTINVLLRFLSGYKSKMLLQAGASDPQVVLSSEH